MAAVISMILNMLLNKEEGRQTQTVLLLALTTFARLQEKCIRTDAPLCIRPEP